MIQLPRSQGDLLKTVRGKRSQAEFARVLGCDRSCLSRYEREALGAPTGVINFCLTAFATGSANPASEAEPLAQALNHTRRAVVALEAIAASQASSSRCKSSK